MERKTCIALAVGAGYLLGRRRKLRLALTLGAAAMAGRLSTNPQALLRFGERLVPSGAGLDGLADLGKPLAVAGRAAAAAAVSKGIDSVGDRMRRKTEALRGESRAGMSRVGEDSEGYGRKARQDKEYPDEEYRDEEYPEDEYGEPEHPEDEEPPVYRPARQRQTAGEASRRRRGR